MATNINEVAALLIQGKKLNSEQQSVYDSNKAQIDALITKELTGGKTQGVGDIYGNHDEPPISGGDLKEVTIVDKKSEPKQKESNGLLSSGIGAVVGAVLGIGLGLLTGGVSWAVVGVCALTGSGLGYSCSGIHDDDRAIKIQQKLEINMNIVNKPSEELLNKLDELITLITEMRNGQQVTQGQIQVIIDSLEGMGASLGTITALLVRMGADFDTIIGFLRNIDGGIEVQTQLIRQLCRGNERLIRLVTRFMNQQAQHNVTQNQLMTRILEIISHMSQAQDDAIEFFAALGEAILNKIPDGANPQDYMAILQEISEKLGNIQGTLATNLVTMIDKLDTINENILAGFATIIANQNTQITNQGEILDAINSIKPILQAIYNKIPAGFDDSQITALLTQLSAQLGVANGTLYEIWQAIPQGCNCEGHTLDLSVVVNLLTQILNKIDPGSGSGSNEGDVGNSELD